MLWSEGGGGWAVGVEGGGMAGGEKNGAEEEGIATVCLLSKEETSGAVAVAV